MLQQSKALPFQQIYTDFSSHLATLLVAAPPPPEIFLPVQFPDPWNTGNLSKQRGKNSTKKLHPRTKINWKQASKQYFRAFPESPRLEESRLGSWKKVRQFGTVRPSVGTLPPLGVRLGLPLDCARQTRGQDPVVREFARSSRRELVILSRTQASAKYTQFCHKVTVSYTYLSN